MWSISSGQCGFDIVSFAKRTTHVLLLLLLIKSITNKLIA
jgi:hypothetical protein